ncbi:26S proteasome non-ATPase subunit 4-like protein [Apostichopus japonicus]|uniref:26S proteasome non-ATPase regulatory subunit 4 n=1 Tax=Stichopus japonicus TaxID=307972 RepID=A0A2G8LGL9_STIJA|nr:26S proteasome non-ATPase subunit 4-like protein [Apostichopus japonicus]
MVLESTIVCADTSEYMRNGDFVPTRIQAQQDAVNLVCLSKTKSNPENNVGLIAMSPNVKVLVTMTSEVEIILANLHQCHPEGSLNFLTGIKVAHLALKHRQGKNHRMRIVAFVGSPIENEEKELVKLAKKLKKEKVNVDIINFGQDSDNTEKLTTFINTINGSEGTGSHLVTIPPGTLLSDALMHSPVIVGEDGSGAVPGLPGTGGGEFEFGFDPASDPELAMALRISMEEQRQRQEDETKQVIEDTAGETTPKPTTDTDTTNNTSSNHCYSEEALLEQALAMSMNPAAETTSSMEEAPIPDFSNMTEEQQIAYAMQMSLAPDEEAETPMETDAGGSSKTDDAKAEGGTEDYSEVMSDPTFLRSVLENLPGVDPSSETVQNAMGSLLQQQTTKDEDQRKKKGGKKDGEDKDGKKK